MLRIPWYKIIIDLITITILGVLFLIFKYVVHPSKTGFYCNDYSVNLPYKSSTVPNYLLFIISFVVPFLFILASEICRGVYGQVKRGLNGGKICINQYLFMLPKKREISLNETIGNILVNIFYLSFGHLCNSLITLIAKKTIGRLRPNFLDVCKPEKNPYTTYCNTHLTGATYLIPGVDFKCLSSDPSEVFYNKAMTFLSFSLS